jgi:hypothetical protein
MSVLITSNVLIVCMQLNVVACVQEKEFLSAYRVHMLSVQLELKELKEKYWCFYINNYIAYA